MKKICDICGCEFEAKSNRQKHCNRKLSKECDVCGKTIEYRCGKHVPSTCSKSCSAKKVPNEERECLRCGSKFTIRNSNQKYCCERKTKICPICGCEFEYICDSVGPAVTCGKMDCREAAAEEGKRRFLSEHKRECELCGKEFTPTSMTQRFCDSKYHSIPCAVCGKPFEQETSKIPNGYRTTCSKECESKLRSIHNAAGTEESISKRKRTSLERYGFDHPSMSDSVKQRMSATYKSRTGYDHPSHNPESRSKSARSRRASNLEKRVASLLDQYGIDYEQHHMVVNGDKSHEFDFYIPEYSILLDADGVYFHSYLSDPNGKQVLDCYDDVRLASIPEDHTFILAVEGEEDKAVKRLVDTIKSIDSGAFDHDVTTFEWCRSIGFPYPEYSDSRMMKDYSSLCKYHSDIYNPRSRLGISIIKNFHRSMYHCVVGNSSVSPYDAWNDDAKLKKAILNRHIYIDDVDPSKVLRGFNVSGICKTVSMFNPVLARYLSLNYLSDYNEVFDPFSGFSGRLLGVASTGKRYIGSDIRYDVVDESSKIVDFLVLDECKVSVADVLESSGSYESLMTCPPYGSKERYFNGMESMSCDDWIDECLDRFDCRRYVFVVDRTDRYKKNVVEDIVSESHFAKVVEHIVVI